MLGVVINLNYNIREDDRLEKILVKRKHFMKVSKKIRLMSCCGLAIFILAACATNQNQSMEKQNSTTSTLSSSDKENYKGTYSNLNSKESEEEVRKALAAHLDKDSVDAFFNLVNDYNNRL